MVGILFLGLSALESLASACALASASATIRPFRAPLRCGGGLRCTPPTHQALQARQPLSQ
jgi:hypothetical protein